MLHCGLELVTIDLIDEVHFLQLLGARFQRLLVSNDIAVIRRCIRNIDIKVDCSPCKPGPRMYMLGKRYTYML